MRHSVNRPRHAATRPPRRRIAIATGGVLLVAGVVAGGLGFADSGAPEIPEHVAQTAVSASYSEVPPVRSPTPVPVTAETPKPSASEKPAQTIPNSIGKMLVPSVNLSAPLLSMTVPANGVLSPPSFGDAFVVNGYGSVHDPNSSTVFVAIHSAPGSMDAVGNALQNTDGEPIVSNETRIYLDGVAFQVSGSRTIPKGSLASTTELWTNQHDLVLVTCSEDAAAAVRGHASDNAVIFAERV